jgi:regulator of protease activity HflC (stomatin/prohibitin superfamily)
MPDVPVSKGLRVADIERGTSRDGRPEPVTALALLVLGAGLLIAALMRHAVAGYLKPLFFQLAAAFLIAAAGFLTAWFTQIARSRPARRRRLVDWQPKKPLPKFAEPVRAFVFKVVNRVLSVDWAGDWLPLGVAVLLSAVALFALFKGWRSDAVLPAARLPLITGGLVALAFPFLVLERRLATLPAGRIAEGKSLTYLLRLLLFTLMGLALSYALRWFALPLPIVIEHIVIIFDALVGFELALRGLAYLFMPLPPLATRHHATSMIASLLRLQRPSLSAIQASMNTQFGIDLGRSWALGYIRRAMLPMLGGMVLAAWLLTGFSTLGLSERAVVEAFGRPLWVAHPGLHVGLPWPFGGMKPVEYGVVHEIPIAFLDEEVYGTPMKEKAAAPETPTIEGPQPLSADRLWEASRPTEASYLVASNKNGQENFEVINIDLRIIYRIGLSDDAALNAAYGVAAPDDVIRAAAGRMLARYFARYTMTAIMGQDREAFIRNFQRELQARVNTISNGIDVLGVVIETIHPPAGAAEAYQQVQAAGIDAITKVANARGDAVRDVRQAEADAIQSRDGATAQAAETIADAKVGTALFAGDVQAYHAGGPAFLFEKRLANLEGAIKAETPVVILDSRIPAGALQMLQMKPPAPQPGQ